jgi:hypothetical protein
MKDHNTVLASKVAKAYDLENLLDHIAWEELLKPGLVSERNALITQLVDSALGSPLKNQDGTSVSTEQLAGKLYGINYILDKIERILSEGVSASDKLTAQGLHLK